MENKQEIVENWLPRYTGTDLAEFGTHILLTNFTEYMQKFSDRFNAPIRGENRPMQTCTNSQGLTMINFGIGSANAATIMDLLTAITPEAVLFLGKCGGAKKSTEIGHFILPMAAIRGEGTSDDYLDPLVPALPSFKLHKFVSEKVIASGLEYRTGVIYTTNRRVWEHDEEFKNRLSRMRVTGIDMETATIFTVGFINDIARGALLMVSDKPMTPEGVKTESSDKHVSGKYVDIHIDVGIEAMTEIDSKGEKIKHFHF